MLQNALIRITQSTHTLSTTYLHLLHSGRFTDEFFKPCKRLKLPVVIIPVVVEMLSHHKFSDVNRKYFICLLLRPELECTLHVVWLPCPFQYNLVASLTLYLHSSTKLLATQN